MRGKIFDLYNVFPEYIVISVPLFNDVIRDELDEWLYVVKHSEVKKDFKSPYMKKVEKRLDILKMTPKAQIIYRAYIYMNKSYKERDYIVSAEEKGREQGMAKGIEEGRKKGKQEGIQEGEVTKSIKIAKKMLMKKNSIEEIHEITEVSIKEIERLQTEIENLKK
nr:Rpn family recombination-promoting nuclease/putative transposase [Rickettsia rhipicephali]